MVNKVSFMQKITCATINLKEEAVYTYLNQSNFNIISLADVSNLELILYSEEFSIHLLIVDTSTLSVKESCNMLKVVNQVNNNVPCLFIISKFDHTLKYDTISNNVLYRFLLSPVDKRELNIILDDLTTFNTNIYDNSCIIKYRDITIDIASKKSYRNNKELDIKPIEYKILEMLVKTPNQIISRKEIIKYVWGASTDIDVRTVDVHMNRLRKSIKNDTDTGSIIKTIRMYGYCLNINPNTTPQK